MPGQPRAGASPAPGSSCRAAPSGAERAPSCGGTAGGPGLSARSVLRAPGWARRGTGPGTGGDQQQLDDDSVSDSVSDSVGVCAEGGPGSEELRGVCPHWGMANDVPVCGAGRWIKAGHSWV